MKTSNIRWVGLLTLAAFPFCSGYSQNSTAPVGSVPIPSSTNTTTIVTPSPTPGNPPIISIVKPANDTTEVLKLTKAGMSDEVIVAYINGSRSTYNLSANDILHLKDQGVSGPVMTAMLTHDRVLRTQAEAQQLFSAGNQPGPGQTATQPPSQSDLSAGTTQIVTPPLVPTASPDGSQPPPAQVETVPVAPGPDYYWAPGYWGWNGGWIWVGGGWCPRGFGWGWRGWGWHGGWGGGWHGSGWHGGGWGRSTGGSTGGSHGSSGGSGGWGRSSGGSHGH